MEQPKFFYTDGEKAKWYSHLGKGLKVFNRMKYMRSV